MLVIAFFLLPCVLEVFCFKYAEQKVIKILLFKCIFSIALCCFSVLKYGSGVRNGQDLQQALDKGHYLKAKLGQFNP